ncbi:aspartate-semialdehyde dehydrogenase [Bacillus carboniphilus]|uniref:Aspartate-semialdehyde dehydrogenase n=1 Tax=Bacillus carboniphilus TaxID=86663 RepID=A0ABY9JVQ7_9BACI|nr:aspartate-semialdehyde dehydrogenase [Bacillus carboniphilus]WLR43494.1 aspartate-semialdehyde dehydrogenase [Bacillus carboniphilus]
MTMKQYNVAIVGATGAVGEQIMNTLIKRKFPIATLKLLSSARSAGKIIYFQGQPIKVEEARPESFEGIEVAFFSAGGSVSKQLAEAAVNRGAIVIDNTSAFRMDHHVPLVVPEVNKEDLKNHNGIIANPNCSTIQMVVALKPLDQAFGLRKVIVSTYQAVSGAGHEAIEELQEQASRMLSNRPYEASVLPVKGEKKHFPIAFNAIPQIDVFQDNGFTFEEIKMINETKKIMHRTDLQVAATCVRLPIITGHSESVYIELDRNDLSVEEIKSQLLVASGVELKDDPSNQVYPTPLDAEGKDATFVGRIRKDLDQPNGFHLWIVSDNLLKGAALNSVQIAESMIELELI